MQNLHPFYRDAPVRRGNLPAGIVYPVEFAIIRRKIMNNTYGMVRRNRDGSTRPHQGWDFAALPGSPVRAIADGVITDVRNRGALGLHVLLKFKKGRDEFFATYCHLSDVNVQPGQAVGMGQVIGASGDSGNARGMLGIDGHLHFEIRTSRWAGFGLANRFSPMVVFEDFPLREIHTS